MHAPALNIPDNKMGTIRTHSGVMAYYVFEDALFNRREDTAFRMAADNFRSGTLSTAGPAHNVAVLRVGPGRVEYRMPHSDYRILGNVVGQSVQGQDIYYFRSIVRHTAVSSWIGSGFTTPVDNLFSVRTPASAQIEAATDRSMREVPRTATADMPKAIRGRHNRFSGVVHRAKNAIKDVAAGAYRFDQGITTQEPAPTRASVKRIVPVSIATAPRPILPTLFNIDSAVLAAWSYKKLSTSVRPEANFERGKRDIDLGNNIQAEVNFIKATHGAVPGAMRELIQVYEGMSKPQLVELSTAGHPVAQQIISSVGVSDHKKFLQSTLDLADSLKSGDGRVMMALAGSDYYGKSVPQNYKTSLEALKIAILMFKEKKLRHAMKSEKSWSYCCLRLFTLKDGYITQVALG